MRSARNAYIWIVSLMLAFNAGQSLADDFSEVAKVFREVCFERANQFDEAESVLEEYGAQRVIQESRCIGGVSSRLSQWSFASTELVTDWRFFLADVPASTEGLPTKYMCGVQAVLDDSEKLGKAIVEELHGFWDKGRSREYTLADVREWPVIRKGAGFGLATSAIYPDKYEFNLAFEKVLEPCSKTD